MRVLLVATEVPPAVGGMQTWTTDVIRGLAARLDVAIVCPSTANTLLLREAGAVFAYAIDRMHARTIGRPHEIIATVLESANRHRADIVHLGQAGLAFLAAPLAQAGFTVVLTVHGNDLTRPWLHMDRIPGPHWADHWRECFRHVRRVSTLSRHSRRLALKAGAQPPVLRIPPAIDAARFSPGNRAEARALLKLPADRPVLLSVGRLMERKGHLDVITALPGLVKYNPLYVIVGQGPMSEPIAEHCKEQNLEAHVWQVGRVTENELVQYYRAADLFVLPTHPRVDDLGFDCEGYGLVYLEAAACAVPVVAANSGGVADAVLDGVTGTLVPPRDVAALGAAIESLLTDQQKAADFAAAARERVLKDFTRQRLAKRLERMYSEALPSPSGATL